MVTQIQLLLVSALQLSVTATRNPERPLPLASFSSEKGGREDAIQGGTKWSFSLGVRRGGASERWQLVRLYSKKMSSILQQPSSPLGMA